MSDLVQGDFNFNWRKAVEFLSRKLEAYEQELQLREAQILFIDDDPADVQLFLSYAQNYRCKVHVYYDPQAAAAALNAQAFDFVFIDQKMPKITGLEILQSAEPRPSTAFFLVTGYQDSTLADRVLKLGYFYAPKESLGQTLELFLRKR